MKTPEQTSVSADAAEPMPWGRRFRRSLARRFPTARRGYLWIAARLRHILGRIRGGVRKIGSSVSWAWLLMAAIRRHRRDSRLTVAVDVAAFWEPLTGIGWYLLRLLENLADRDDLSVQMFSPSIIQSPDLQGPAVELPTGPALAVLGYEVPPEKVLFAGTLTRLLRRLEPLLIAAHGSDVLFAPNYFLPRRFSLARGALVATIHDVGFREVPWTLRDETLQELSDRLDQTLRKASRVITVSGAVKQELLREGYSDPDRIHVIHHGPGQLSTVTASELPHDLPERFALHVGTLEPRKNIEGLLGCWRELRQRLPSAPVLVLCGKYGWKAEAIRQGVESGEREGWLRHLGYVEDALLAALYKHALLVVFPSLYEGFGLPAVEAQWAGTPLVCSDLPVLREVAGEGALFAPADRPDLLAEAVVEVLENPTQRERLIREGRRRSRRLSWRRAAEETVSVWRLSLER